MVIAIVVAFVVVIHVQCLVSVYLSLVKIKYSVCVWKKKTKKTNGSQKANKNIQIAYEFYRQNSSISASAK